MRDANGNFGRFLFQSEEAQHQQGDKFDRLSETAKSGECVCV